MGLLHTKLQLFKNIDFGSHASQGHKTWKRKLAIILVTVRDRAKRSKFSNPVVLLPTKLQLLKILSSGPHDLANVNWPLSR